jgi:hypothetical protein
MKGRMNQMCSLRARIGRKRDQGEMSYTRHGRERVMFLTRTWLQVGEGVAMSFEGENERELMGVQMAGGIDLISKSGDGKCSLVSPPKRSHVKIVERITRSSRRSLGATSIPPRGLSSRVISPCRIFKLHNTAASALFTKATRNESSVSPGRSQPSVQPLDLPHRNHGSSESHRL